MDQPAPNHYWKVIFCEKFGWTFDEFDRMSIEDFQLTVGVWQGIEKASKRK